MCKITRSVSITKTEEDQTRVLPRRLLIHKQIGIIMNPRSPGVAALICCPLPRVLIWESITHTTLSNKPI